MAHGTTDPEQKMRRKWVKNYGCCLARGGARCRTYRWYRKHGRKPKAVK